MALIKWPDSLPLPLLKGYGYTPAVEFTEVKMDSGTSRFRHRKAAKYDAVSASFLMTNDQAAFFEGWFKHAVLDGEKWFSMPIKTTLGVVDRTVRIKAKQKKRSPVGNRLWRLLLDLDVKAV